MASLRGRIEFDVSEMTLREEVRMRVDEGGQRQPQGNGKASGRKKSGFHPTALTWRVTWLVNGRDWSAGPVVNSLLLLLFLALVPCFHQFALWYLRPWFNFNLTESYFRSIWQKRPPNFLDMKIKISPLKFTHPNQKKVCLLAAFSIHTFARRVFWKNFQHVYVAYSAATNKTSR